MNYQNITNNLLSFLKNSLRESSCESFLVGLSGGLDSALTLTLCSLIKDVKTHALLMPSAVSNKENLKDALALCEKEKVSYEVLNIEDILQAYKGTLQGEINARRLGNLAARIRMSLLYDISAQLNACVVGTSNLSERMLGYFTIFGDNACAFNPLGQLFKSDIFELAKYLNIDEALISKAPSADLFEGQSDEGDFGFSYKEIDEVLKRIYFGKASDKDLYENFKEDLVTFVLHRIKANSFKLQAIESAKIIYT